MNSSLRIILYHHQFKQIWDTFVSKAKNATFLFYRDFMEYHQDRFEDFSLMVFKNEKLVAVLPANKINDELFSHQGLTYGGLVLPASLKFQEVLDIFQLVLKYLNDNHIKKFVLKQMPTIYCSWPSDELQYLMFILQAKLFRRDALSVIDLSQKLNISDNRMEGVKRAQKIGLTILEEDTFDGFWNEILIPNLKEKHGATPAHSLEEITLLKKCFPKNIRQFNVYEKDILVAGTTIFETNEVAHSQYISGNADKNQIGSLDALHYHLITEVFKHKTFFDFGISNENHGKNVNKGLQFWKEGFGARTITQDFYEIKTESHKLLDKVFI